jgi:hypothetical protein
VYDACVRILSWASTRPDDEPGFGILLAQLQALVVRLGEVIAMQRNGIVDSRAASARKQELRREILAVPVAHLAEIGALAAPEVPELGKAFRSQPSRTRTVAFQAACRSMLEQAQTHKEVLSKHGLSESAVVELERLLDQFDAAVRLGAEGRMRHTAATRELVALTKEAGRLVRAMEARVRIRYRGDRAALEQWVSARTVLGTPQRLGAPVEGGTPNAGGDVRPAA